MENLQKEINELTYQRFTLTENTIIPDPKGQNNLNHLFKKMPLSSIKGKSILDVGCSLGLFSIICKQAGAEHVMGIDPFGEAIILAKKVSKFLNLDIEYRIEKMADSLLYEGSFDLLLCMSCYHYIFNEYKDHDRIFQIFYQLCDEMFFEGGLNSDSDESITKMFLNKEISDFKKDYTKEKFLETANKYFEVEYLGLQSGGKREIYWMKKRKKIQKKYKITEIVFHNTKTGTIVKKIQTLSGKIYCLKEITLPTYCSAELKKYFEECYNIHYEKIKDIPLMTKIYRTWTKGNIFYVLQEYHSGYKNIYHYENSKFLEDTEKNMTFLNGYKTYKSGKLLTKEQKIIIYHKIMDFLAEIHNRGVFLPDFGLKNFMTNRDLDIKAIDFEYLITPNAYINEGETKWARKSDLLHIFYSFMRYMFEWLGKENDTIS